MKIKQINKLNYTYKLHELFHSSNKKKLPTYLHTYV